MSRLTPLPSPRSFRELKRDPVKGVEYADGERPTCEQLMTLPRFVTGEIFYGLPTKFTIDPKFCVDEGNVQ